MEITTLIIGISGSLVIILAGVYNYFQSTKDITEIKSKNDEFISKARERLNSIAVDKKNEIYLHAFDDTELLSDTYYKTSKARERLLIITVIATFIGFIVVMIGVLKITKSDLSGIGEVIIGFLQATFYYLLNNKNKEVIRNNEQMEKGKEFIRLIEALSDKNKKDEIIIKIALVSKISDTKLRDEAILTIVSNLNKT